MDFVVNRKRKFSNDDDSSSFGRPHATYFQYLPYELQGYLGLYARQPLPTDEGGRHLAAVCELEKAYDRLRWEELRGMTHLTFNPAATHDFRYAVLTVDRGPPRYPVSIMFNDFSLRPTPGRLPESALPRIRKLYEEGLLTLADKEEARWKVIAVRPEACFRIPNQNYVSLLEEVVSKSTQIPENLDKAEEAWINLSKEVQDYL